MSVHEKLATIQAELKAPRGQTNQHFKYSYRSCEDIIEAVKPLANKEKCVVLLSDDLQEIGGRFYIKATATLSDGTDSVSTTAFAQEPVASSRMDASQCSGSASTYARKYALNGLFAIDDTKDADFTAGSEPKPASQQAPAKPAAAPQQRTTSTAPASPKQIEYINKLAAEKGTTVVTDGINKTEASALIESLK